MGTQEVQTASLAVDVPEGLRFVFRLNASLDSAKTTVYFKKKPLGMSFHSGKIPILVREVPVDGEAIKLGIQAGMVIEMIAEKDVTECTYEEAFEHMKAKVGQLPKNQ